MKPLVGIPWHPPEGFVNHLTFITVLVFIRALRLFQHSWMFWSLLLNLAVVPFRFAETLDSGRPKTVLCSLTFFCLSPLIALPPLSLLAQVIDSLFFPCLNIPSPSLSLSPEVFFPAYRISVPSRPVLSLFLCSCFFLYCVCKKESNMKTC